MTTPLVAHLTVTGVEQLTPLVVRVRFTGEGLAGLRTWPDQQLKLCFPRPGQDRPTLPAPDEDAMRWYQAYLAIPEPERPLMRSYTVRAHDPATATIDIDFVLHGDGPAATWARQAAPGDVLGRYGPDEQYRVPPRDSDWVLLAGDQSALPAIATHLESLPSSRRALVYLEVADQAEHQELPGKADVRVHWLHRDGRPVGRTSLLLDAVRQAEFPEGQGLFWLAGEAGAVRDLRRHLVNERGIPKRDIDFTGYWRYRLTQDDAPTEEDLAEAQERLAQHTFDQAYESDQAPWEINQPQPAVQALVDQGEFRGRILDAGCGTGEHTLLLAARGHDVLGLDFAPQALAAARAKAVTRGVEARFREADATTLPEREAYDTVLDSALFHVFDDQTRAAYVSSLHRVTRPGGVVHLLALSDRGPGFGPQVSESTIREAFTEGWEVASLTESTYRGVLGRTAEGEPELGDLPAWLARIRRR